MTRTIATVLAASLGAGAALAREGNPVEAWLVEKVRAGLYEHATPEAARKLGPAAFDVLDRILEARPASRPLLVAGAEFHTAWAAAFQHESEPATAREHYEKAFDLATRALENPEAFRAAASAGGKALEDELARRTSERDLAALYWAAASWGLRLDLARDSLETPLELPSTTAIMKRILEVAPDFEHGGPDLFLARQEAVLGQGLGGSIDRMRGHYEAALEKTGGRDLVVWVEYAANYAVATQDRELFEETLRVVLATDPRVDPARAFTNRIAQGRATSLLARVDEFFP